MPVDRIRRGSAPAPNKGNTPTASVLYVDTDNETLKFGAAATGTTEKEAADLTSTQTLTNKTLTSPTITSPTVSGAIVTPAVTVISGDGAITIASGIVVLTKGSAAAITLAAPSAGQAGTRITVTSRTAFAHVVTATNLINDGVGPTLDTATFAAQPGASITFIADNLLWNVESLKAVTVAGS